MPLNDPDAQPDNYETASIQSLEILSDITLDVKPGQLVGVVGAVGAGKSSVLSSILREVCRELFLKQPRPYPI